MTAFYCAQKHQVSLVVSAPRIAAAPLVGLKRYRLDSIATASPLQRNDEDNTAEVALRWELLRRDVTRQYDERSA